MHGIPPDKEELHITSLVVHAQPGDAQAVDAFITALPGARIHGSDANGKRVVTLEAPSAAAIVDLVSAIQQAHGVINVAMVYQHAEPLESLNTEIPNVDNPT
ncbi:chaperone NapD [Xylophilus sp.]|uniref:chaperone NapD n=1 Tax=Xylophilus sp. TaxID=2653893 RepID=UPI0013BC1B15|nr:chaperone NapD [Xylophilus sp.]KAF1050159.1 MAG: Chaperone NapD [Xylophilus sp.]